MVSSGSPGGAWFHVLCAWRQDRDLIPAELGDTDSQEMTHRDSNRGQQLRPKDEGNKNPV